jgi:hypothetical protein
MNERMTMRLSALLAYLKRNASAVSRRLVSVIKNGVKSTLPDIGKSERTLPPVSKATGGLIPGIDLTAFSTLQAIDDLEYVERMKCSADL